MHEIRKKVLLSLPSVFGIDLSITNEVVLLWFSASITFVLLFLVCRRKNHIARGAIQNLFEAVIEFIEKSVVREGIGSSGRMWSPLLLTLFFFILFCNLTGMLPFPSHVKAMTSNINVTAALAVFVFFLTIGISVRTQGFMGFLKGFVPDGVPVWITVFVVPIEVISWLAKPFSLAVRLFANMFVGHMLIMMFVSLTVSVAWFLKPLPLIGAVIMSCFELLVSFIQAFVFTMLTGIYIKESLEAH